MTKSYVLCSSVDFDNWKEGLSQVRHGRTFHPIVYGETKPESYPCIAVAYLSEDSQSRDTADIDFVYLTDFPEMLIS